MIEKLEKEIPVLICKLEKIFPLGWFNSMQHLLVHLSYEAKLAGLKQYKWMYHIERALKNHRAMVHNKARVEGCIAEEFKLKENTYFTSCHTPVLKSTEPKPLYVCPGCLITRIATI
jgi:hypothetical protein